MKLTAVYANAMREVRQSNMWICAEILMMAAAVKISSYVGFPFSTMRIGYSAFFFSQCDFVTQI